MRTQDNHSRRRRSYKKWVGRKVIEKKSGHEYRCGYSGHGIGYYGIYVGSVYMGCFSYYKLRKYFKEAI